MFMKNLMVIEGGRLKSLHATSPTHGGLYGVVFSGIFLPLPAKIFLPLPAKRRGSFVLRAFGSVFG